MKQGLSHYDIAYIKSVRLLTVPLRFKKYLNPNMLIPISKKTSEAEIS